MNLGLDLAGGAAMAAVEKYGDWYRDPWSWPELTAGVVSPLDAEHDLGIQRDGRGDFHLTDRPHFHLLDVPKSRLGVRPAVVQDPISRLAYLAAVSSSLSALHGDLPDWVYGWRTRAEGTLAPNRGEWADYAQSLPSPDQEGWGLQTDLTSFFASVEPARLQEVLRSKLGNVAALHVIMDVVTAHDELSSRSGLPQRSFASAALAHSILCPIDDALATALVDPGVSNARRWMDDISAEGDEEPLYALLMSLQDRARQVGLELNSSKTHLVPASESASDLHLEDLREIEVPVGLVPGEGYEDPRIEPDLDVLVRLEQTILDDPFNVRRTLARAVLRTLRDHGLFDREQQWREVARHLPHAADALSRYLRAAGEADAVSWDTLASWFDDYHKSAWGRLDWVSSQYALIFPGATLPDSVARVLRSWLESSGNLQQLAIAVQRLGGAAPALARTAIRNRLDRTEDPLVLRAFALGLLAAGEPQSVVENSLRRDPRNRLLLRLLEAGRWRPLAVAADFDLGTDSEP